MSIIYKTIAVLLLLGSFGTLKSGMIDVQAQEIECLAQNLYYEARGESTKGQIAVGMVTMNRVKSPGYPDTVCGVVTQKHKKTCQFSWVCNKKLPRIKEDIYENTKELAHKIYHGEVKDITRGATHFHNHTVVPIWAQTKRMTVQIGNHFFYRKH